MSRYVKTCPVCGYQNSEFAVICETCREDLLGVPKRPEIKTEPTAQEEHNETAGADAGGEFAERETRLGQAHPYPGYPQATTPCQLAANLDRFNAENQLFREEIRSWVVDNYFGANLAERIEEIEGNYAERRALGVFKLRYVLDPSLPLRVGERCVTTLRELADLLASDQEEILKPLEALLWNEQLEAWLDAIRPVPRSAELVDRIGAMRERLVYSQPRIVLIALLYTLDPQRPLTITRDACIHKPSDLDTLLQRRPELAPNLHEIFDTGVFEEWLRAAEITDWEAMVNYIQDCRRRYASNDRLRSHAMIWYFCPSVPFSFANEQVAEPATLAARIERSDRTRREAIELLEQGWLAAWLVARGHVERHVIDAALANTQADIDVRLEAVLRLLDPNLLTPAIECRPLKLDFGRVSVQTPKTRKITVINSTRGQLRGAATLVHDDRGVRVEPMRIQGARTVVRVTVDARGLAVGSRHETTLNVQSNGGAVAIPIRFRACAPAGRIATRCLIAGAVSAGIFGGFRSFLEYAFRHYPGSRLDWIPAGANTLFSGEPLVHGGPFFIPVALLVGAIAALLYYVRLRANSS